MTTAGKVPFLGFKAALKNLIWLGFGASAGAGTDFTGTSLHVAAVSSAGQTVTDLQSSGMTVSGFSSSGLQITGVESV